MLPDMVRKEILMHVIAWNAVRALILRSAIEQGVELGRISFKGTLYLVSHWLLEAAKCYDKPVFKGIISACLPLFSGLVPDMNRLIVLILSVGISIDAGAEDLVGLRVVYHKVIITRVTATEVRFTHQDGVASLPLTALPA